MPRNSSDSKIHRFRKGAKSISSRHINSLVDAVNRTLTGVDSPTQPKPTGKGGGSAVLILTLVTHNNDYLVCEDSNSNTINVAKPYELRRTPFHGETIGGVTYTYTSASQRTASDGASPPVEEEQYITPNYVVGHEIYATKISGGTGLDLGDSPPTPINYLEIDQGRAWAWDEEV